MPLLRRILHALDNHGPTPAALRALRRPQPSSSPHPFDRLHHTDTSGHIPGELLATNSPADRYNTAYYAISPSTLTQALAHLPIDPTQFTFLDLGCGKGRALLIAHHHHFARILGIEISPALAATARANAAPYPNISIQTADAATTPHPPGPLIVFLYHPFLAPLLKKALANLLSQHTHDDLYILAANPAYPHVFARFPALSQQWTQDFSLSPEDLAAHPLSLRFERYILWKAAGSPSLAARSQLHPSSGF